MSETCAGCGGPFPPELKPHPRRKWCSERCRKRQYAKPCIDCGKPIDGTTPSRCGGRCTPCANKIPREADLMKRWRIEELWADGHTTREICEAMGLKYATSNVSNWRSRGYDLPHRRTPEQIARMTAGSEQALAKARATWKQMREAA